MPLRIAYCVPGGLGRCGGVRVIIEHVNRLAARGHSVVVVAPSAAPPSWIKLDVPVVPRGGFEQGEPFDVVVATGFQTVEWSLRIPARRRYYFVQMMEYEFFRPGATGHEIALNSYQVAKEHGLRVITIARWLQETMREVWGLDSVIVPNGVNQEHFYPDGFKQAAILVEGDKRNPAKDVEEIGWRVALKLREEHGVKLWGYAAASNPYMGQFDTFVFQPTTAQMRQMYSRAWFLLKASRYEGRACAPVEAMACGTTCARAIIRGDDDLINGSNCVLTRYNYDDLLEAGRMLVQDKKLRARLAHNALVYARDCLRWPDVIDKLEELYSC